jgi:hypothetical protein
MINVSMNREGAFVERLDAFFTVALMMNKNSRPSHGSWIIWRSPEESSILSHSVVTIIDMHDLSVICKDSVP